MNFKQWGMRLRLLFSMLLSLPLIGFGVIAWTGFGVVSDLVGVSEKAIVELPAEKRLEILNLLAKTIDRSEWTLLLVPLALAVVGAAVLGFFFWKFFSKLAQDSLSVITAAKEMSSVQAHLSQSSEKLSHVSTQSSVALEQSVSAIESFAQTLLRTAGDVDEADKASRNAVDEASRGEIELQTVVQSLAELTSQSRKLEEIINVIDSIAFQTNILAVNAAVEAARAGEKGRGFAIVAEAVRNLAQHSAASAKNISGLIRESGDTSRRAIAAVRSGAERLSAATGQVKRSQSIVHKISTSTSELTQSLTRMSQSLSQLDATTRSVFNSSDTSEEKLEKWNKNFAALNESVEQFGQILRNAEEAWAEERERSRQAETAPGAAPAVLDEKPDGRVLEKTPTLRPSLRTTTLTTDSASRMVKKPASAPAPSASRGVKTNVKVRARDVIPFEGDSESESSTDVKLGSTSGF